MRVPILAIFVYLALTAACQRVESTEHVKSVVVTPTPQTNGNQVVPEGFPKVAAVKPKVNLSSKERKYLDESIPAEARTILENAERFELLGEIDKDESSESDNRSFEPNRFLAISSEKDKLAVLEALYEDAAREDSPAVCYEPHHAIRAEFRGEIVEVEICFSCSRFVLKHGSNKYSGTIVREGRRSEVLFETFFGPQV